MPKWFVVGAVTISLAVAVILMGAAHKAKAQDNYYTEIDAMVIEPCAFVGLVYETDGDVERAKRLTKTAARMSPQMVQQAYLSLIPLVQGRPLHFRKAIYGEYLLGCTTTIIAMYSGTAL